MKSRSILLAGALALALASMASVANDSHTIRMHFSKCPIWGPASSGPPPAGTPAGTVFVNTGTVTGAVTGTLTVYGQPGSFSGSLAPGVLFLDAKYIVSAGAKSFTAHVGGLYDTNVGQAVLNGFVSEGPLLGGKVTDEFHAIPPNCVAGTLTIAPWRLPDDDDDDNN